MTEHLCNKEDTIDEIKKDLKELLKLCKGNGRIGFFAMCRLTYEWMIEKKKDKHDIAMYVYRFGIVIVLGYIAVQLGIK